MRTRTKILTTLVLAAAFPLAGFAKDEHAKSACNDDIKRLCKKVKGDEAVTKCLNDNVQNITVGCKASLDDAALTKEVQEGVRTLQTTCKSDLETLCPAVSKGKGRKLRCLRSQQEKLTEPCRNLLVEMGTLDPVPSKAVDTAKVVKEEPKSAVETKTEIKTETKAETKPEPAAPVTKK